MDTTQTEQKEPSLFYTILQIASVWILADIGYYIFIPAFGLKEGYNSSPVPIAIYYFVWTLIAIFAFWDIYKKWDTPKSRQSAYVLMLVGSATVVFYLTYIMPMFPAITWNLPWTPPSEILYATPWYFLPKSMDIFLQQLLVVAVVVSFYSRKYNIETVSAWCAGLFGGAHLLLAFGGGGFIYVAVFTIVAIVASFIFPYLILRVKNGFIYSYFLHWLFYAVVIVLTRVIFKV